MNLILWCSLFYVTLVGALFWHFKDDYIEFSGTLWTHALNLLIIGGSTLLVVIVTWDLLVATVHQAPGRSRHEAASVISIVGAYELIPCALFMARYGIVDMGGLERMRWPTAFGGWGAAGLAASYLVVVSLLS